MENRGNFKVYLNGNGKSGSFSAYIWYQGDIAIHGELSLAYTVAAGQDLTRSEIRQLKQIYDLLQDNGTFPELDSKNSETDIVDLVYQNYRFCQSF